MCAEFIRFDSLVTPLLLSSQISMSKLKLCVVLSIKIGTTCVMFHSILSMFLNVEELCLVAVQSLVHNTYLLVATCNSQLPCKSIIYHHANCGIMLIA